MRIATTVFAAIALIGTTLTPALAQTKPVPDELEGWWVPPSARGATCRTPAVEKQIGFFIWELAQDQKELQPLQAKADEVRASMTKSLMSGKATGTDVDYDVKSATGYLQYLDGKIHTLEDRIARTQRAKQYLESLPPCMQGTEHAAETPPPPPPPAPPKGPPPATGGVLVPGAPAPINTTNRVGYYNSPLEAWFYNTPYYNTPTYNSPLEAWFYNTPYEPSIWDGLYIGVDAGPSFVPTVMATEFFTDGKDRFPWGSDTGFYLGAQVGKQVGNWRFEGQYTWSVNPAAATMPLPPNVKIGGETETHGFFANGIYTPPFVLGIPVTPHIGVGIGALDVSTTIKVNGTKVFNSDNWAPGAQAIGGLTWKISPRLSLDLDYRYQTSLGDVEYKSLANGNNPRNKVDSPYHAHYITLGLNLHFPSAAPPPGGTRPPGFVPQSVNPTPPPPAPRSEIPQARQVASLAPVETAAAAAHRFTLRYDEANAVLTPTSVRALHEALDAIETGQSVRIAIAGCETGADYSDGSLCARHALKLRHLLARHGIANPGQLLAGG